jgi:hypothetical protein
VHHQVVLRRLGTAAAVLAGLAGAADGSAAAGPSKPAVTECFESRRVLVDPGASPMLPRSVVPRSRQLALSFVVVPAGDVPGTMALVALSPTRAAAVRLRARIIRYATRGRPVPRPVLRRAFELRGTSVVFWLSGQGHPHERRIVTRCLGPPTA